MATMAELLADDAVKARVEAVQQRYPGKRVRPVETAAGVLILRQPTRPEWECFEQAVWNDEDLPGKARGMKLLVTSIVADPPAADFAKLLEDYPGLASDKDLTLEVRKLAGQTKESALK
jgi:hypothetical protein